MNRLILICAATAVAGISGCISLSITKECCHSYGLSISSPTYPVLAREGKLLFSIGVGAITIDNQYAHPFLTERLANGELKPHEEHCWLENPSIMAADLLRDYYLGWMKEKKITALTPGGYPHYTITGRLLEMSAETGGKVKVRLQVQVVAGDPDGRAPRTIIARIYENIGGSTGGDFTKIPAEVSKALEKIGEDILKDIDSVDTALKSKPTQAPAPVVPSSFTLAGTDAGGRRYQLEISIDAESKAGKLIYTNANGTSTTITISEFTKSKEALGLGVIVNGRKGKLNVRLIGPERAVVKSASVPGLPSSMPCDRNVALKFLEWRRSLALTVDT